MKLRIELKQKNKTSGNTTFKATANVLNIGSDNLESCSKEIAAFCKGVVDLQRKNAKRGYKNAVNCIKKTVPMQITISGVGEDSDIDTVQLYYRNFGKFVSEATEANLRGFLSDNIKFVSDSNFVTE